MLLYLAMRTDTYEGEGVWQSCLGVYDNIDLAQGRCDEYKQFIDDDEKLRHFFEVVSVELNQDIYE